MVSLGNFDSVAVDVQKSRLLNDLAPHPFPHDFNVKEWTRRSSFDTGDLAQALSASTDAHVRPSEGATAASCAATSSTAASGAANSSTAASSCAATSSIAASGASNPNGEAACSAASGKPRARAGPGKTTVSVVNGDCLEEALRLQENGYDPVVLNMASHRRPGGLSPYTHAQNSIF